jgi:hypothetical protein
MKEGEANQQGRLHEDYAAACAEYDAASAVIVTRMEDANSELDAKPTAAEAVAEEQARYKLVAARRRVYQFGADYLESLPIG